MDYPIHKILNNTFGYKEFRLDQEEIINNVLAGNDSLVIMPTGGGKSLCFQIPALAKSGLTLVVSPLIALMNDQVSALKQLNVKAAALHSNTDIGEKNSVFQAIQNKRLDLLYVSPEKLSTPNFLQYLSTIDVTLFAIDEAHCVSIWGNDFRPEYVKLKILKKQFPKTPLIALTATADKATQEDIKKQLGISDSKTFISSFERKNISVEARPGLKRIEQIIRFIQKSPDESGIIYCLSKKSCETVEKKLKDYKINAAYYHAGMSSEERNLIQRRFQDDDIQVICATIAFGMGIDKPNIRWVIHYNMPKNVEGYYQEIGRGGRDGEKARALLFYSWADMTMLQRFVDESNASFEFKKVQSAKLDRIWQYSNTLNCRTNFILNYFGEYRSDPCGHCDNCLNPPKFIDGTQYTQMALSAIIRSNEKIGINLLIDVLRGSQKQEIRNQRLDQIKTFGVGRMIPTSHWHYYINQMISQGIIQIDFSDYSRLKKTPLSADVLKNKTKIQLAEFVKREKAKPPKIEKLDLDYTGIDKDLFQKLRTWRASIAKAKGVPAFTVFHDKTLKQIAVSTPTSEIELLAIDGIGHAKLMNYGPALLEIITAHNG